jgi:nucleoside-diphosphate-sugar epimerase
MRVVVIGASGHVGGYLVPRLVEAGHEVVAVSRGLREPYRPHRAWEQVERVVLDREQEDAAGTFAGKIVDLKPDVVIDMVCFTKESAEQLVEGLRGRVELLLSCGTIWVHGTAVEVPTTEDAVRRPFGAYGTGKAEIEALLLEESRRAGGLRSVVLHPGHITGPGWAMINPAGNLDLEVWRKLAAGEQLTLPHFGLETVHHVHADDVAQGFQRALERQSEAVGNSFHIVSERAITLKGFAEAAASWFGKPAELRFVSFEEYRAQTDESHANATWEHISRSPSSSIEKAKRLLGYSPRYTSLQAVREGLAWLQQNGRVDLGEVPLQA